jgi:tetratricopeptide (TPR) repeat protein
MAYGDRITMTNGSVQDGKITSISIQTGTVMIQASNGTFPVPLTSISNVEMDPPLEFKTAMTSDPRTAISLLEPLIPTYKGLPSDWVPQAMNRLADCYLATGKIDLAKNEILDLQQTYPNGTAKVLAITGLAKVSLASGAPDDALATLKPLLDAADADLIPTAAEAPGYASLFMTEAQIYVALKQPAKALECYTKVKALLYRDPALASEVDKPINVLKKANPGLAVD